MKRVLTAIAGLAILMAACSDTEPADRAEAAVTTTVTTTTTEAPTATTATTEASGATTTVPPTARTFIGADGVESEITDVTRVVSLAGDVTEIIWELGLAGNVVAIDVTTTYPDEAAALPGVGFGQQIAPEAVLAFSPTIVIGDALTGPPEALEQLRSSGVPVILLEQQTTLDGVAVKIRQVAEIMDAVDAGEALAGRVGDEIDQARQLVAGVATSPTVAYVYVRGPQTLLLFGQGMPTGAMIEGANAVDVAAQTGVFGAVPLTPEALVAAAPEAIVLPEAGLGALGGPEAFAGIPGVAETPAGQSGNFLVYEEGYFFNLGPRAGQALQEFILDLYPGLSPSG